jgi:hypothetical protein
LDKIVHQLGEGQALTVEMLTSPFIDDGPRTQKLEADFAVEVLVVGTKDHNYFAAADFFVGTVVGKL